MTTSRRSSAGDVAYAGATFLGGTGKSGQAETDMKGEVLTVAHTDDDLDLDVDDRPALEVVASPPARGSWINVPRVLLIGLDVLAVALAWTFSFLAPWTDWSNHESLRRYWLVIAISSAATLWLLVLFDLYKSRVSSVRSAELAAISRVAALVIPGILFLDLLATTELHLGADLTAGILLFVFLIIGRSIFDGWIRTARSQGRYCRSVVIVGGGPGTRDLMDLLSDHVEAGYRVKGVVADRMLGAASPDWLGEPRDVLEVMESAGANGAFVVVDELNPVDRAVAVEQLTAAGHHVHLTMGIAGISSQRVQLAPVVHEPLLYVDRPNLKQWQLVLKRVVDIVLAGVGIVVIAPFLVLAAAIIKLEDRGPVFFRQERVGLGGRHFRLWKLRTMAPDAEARLHEVQAQNARTGPLLKVNRDPRVTRIGHLLRFTSIDELPQLLNVLRGEMSLVGPRPALPTEVESFDEELRERHNVRPGITGLWQVEARDNPSFASYRRLDLFYVKNWSISLDLVILILTAQSVIVRALKGLVGRGDEDAS